MGDVGPGAQDVVVMVGPDRRMAREHPIAQRPVSRLHESGGRPRRTGDQRRGPATTWIHEYGHGRVPAPSLAEHVIPESPAVRFGHSQRLARDLGPMPVAQIGVISRGCTP